MIPPIPAALQDAKQLLSRMRLVVNGLLDGRMNATGTATLATSTTTTSVLDARVGVDSVITFMPTTARAAAALSSLYVSARMQGEFILTHDSQTHTDRVFAYKVGGG